MNREGPQEDIGLVNSIHVRSYQKNDGGYILMNHGKIVPVSQTQKKKILALLRKYLAI